MPTHKEPFTFYTSYKDIPLNSWNAVIGNKQLFLTIPYLKVIETKLATDVQLIYMLGTLKNGTPILAGVFQIATFTYKKGSQTNVLLKLFQDCKNADDSVSMNGLVCGNIFATGCYGFAHSDTIQFKGALELMAAAAKRIRKNINYEDVYSIQLFKDFDSNLATQTASLYDFKYRGFQADVSMVLAMHPNWTSFSKYLESMKAKYRTKANSAFKKATEITFVSLSISEIETHLERLEELYTNVQKKSNYSYGKHYPRAFKAFKEELGDLFICKGAFLNNQLIGFSTAFVNGTNLEASYVGLDYTYTSSHALYERLLYGFVEDAIVLQSKTLHLGRTSELIKSALGAVPVPMTLFVKHRSKLKNVLLKPIIESIAPTTYELRKPFKAAFYS